MSNYYYKIYLEHIAKNPNKTPAPKNFWPFMYQFYLCNPINVFSAYIKNYDNNPEASILNYIEPDVDRANIPSIRMPVAVLKKQELQELLIIASKKLSKEDNSELRTAISKGHIPEKFRDLLPLRDTDKISVAKTKYTRK